SKILVRMGDLDAKAKHNGEAFANYDRALGVSIDMHLRKPEDERWQRELSWGLNKVGDLALEGSQPDPAKALDLFEAALCIRRTLAERNGANLLLESDVSWTLDRIGRVKAQLKDTIGAVDAFLEFPPIRRGLTYSDPRNVRWPEEFYMALVRFADFKSRNDARLALAFYQNAAKVLENVKLMGGNIGRLPPMRISEEEARRQLSPAGANQIIASWTAYVLAEQDRFEQRLADLQASAFDCWPRLSAALKKMSQERKQITQ